MPINIEAPALVGKDKKVFTTGQVAKICRVAPRTVSKWIDSGRLKGYRVPCSQDRRVTRMSLLSFLRDYEFPIDELAEELQCKVMLAHTDSITNSTLAALLPEDQGYRQLVVGSGFDPVSMAASYEPDVVVVDFWVGRHEACDLAKKLSETFKQKKHEPPMVIGIAGEDEADPDTYLRHGFTNVYKKPFDMIALAHLIQTKE